jgi:hypothetical protein
MTENNTFYTVTPPDLLLPVSGPGVLFLGLEHTEIQQFSEMYDRLFPETTVTFYVRDGEIDDIIITWYRAIAGFATIAIVDLSSITPEELFIATQMVSDDRASVIWYGNPPDCQALISLLNTWNYSVFTSINDIEKFLFNEE